ncbi:MAG: hypothetical protein ACYTHN_24520 [Planctomycetota bacterium]|jgi:uncharacterized membrane protein YraQ (UPF0718 family)
MMWIVGTWDLTKKILPYLLVGVIAAGLLRVFIPERNRAYTQRHRNPCDLVSLRLGRLVAQPARPS